MALRVVYPLATTSMELAISKKDVHGAYGLMQSYWDLLERCASMSALTQVWRVSCCTVPLVE